MAVALIALNGFYLLGWQPGADEEWVAQRLVELDRLFQFVAVKGVPPRVRTAALQAVGVEHLAQLLSVPPVVTGELDSLVAHLGNCRQNAGQVFLALLADRIELQPDGDLGCNGHRGDPPPPPRDGSFRLRQLQTERARGRCSGSEFQQIAT